MVVNLQRKQLDRLKCLLEIEPAEAAKDLTCKLEQEAASLSKNEQCVNPSVDNGLIFSEIINVRVQHDAIEDLVKKRTALEHENKQSIRKFFLKEPNTATFTTTICITSMRKWGT